MPNFNIHWKGYPHHCLPRIRVASTPRTSIRTRSQIAADQVLRIPLGTALEQARKKQRLNFRFRRRCGRSSRSTSTAVRVRRHASQGARQHKQVFGWGTSQAELASKYTRSIRSGRPSTRARARKRSSATFRNQLPTDRIVPSTDGAASSSIRRTKAYKREPENIYSLTHVAEVPVYWRSGKAANRKKSSLNSDRLSIYSARRPGAEYAHVGPLETVSRRNTYRGSQTLGRRRTYDCRIDPKNRLEEGRSKSGPAQIGANSGGPQARSRPQVLAENKRHSRASAELREAVNSLGLLAKAKGSDTTPSSNTLAPSILSDTASRSPSQQKALRIFTREIEHYLQACRLIPKQSLVATPSLTTISAFTIDEFKPYQGQFQSAGLAVTSDEQRGIFQLQEQPPPPPIPPKDEKWSQINSSSDDKMGLRKGKQKEKPTEPSYASGSTGTTVMGFTPPHEKSYPRPKTARQPSSDSDHTIIGFTPPHGRVAPPPARPPPSVPKMPTKKSLPWLRKPDPSPEFVPPTKRMSDTAEADKDSPSSPPGGWVKTIESSTKNDTTPEKITKSGPIVPPRPSTSTRSTNVQKNDMKYSNENSAVNKQPRTSTQQAQATQTDDLAVDALDNTTYTTAYVDMETQTSVETSQPIAEETSVKNDEVEMTRAPIICGCHKTFPLTKSKCRGDCNTALVPMVASSATKSQKRSRVKWEGADRETQIDDIEPITLQPSEGNQVRQEWKNTFKPVPKASERSSTLSFPSSTARGRGPYQASPALASLNKSMDEEKLGTVTQIQDSGEPIAPSTESNLSPPARQVPSPTLCLRCTNELESAALEPDPQLEPQLEPEPDPRPALRPRLCHTCTARSSLICQQCFPSRQTSAAISPLQTSPWEVQYQAYQSSQRSTRDTIPAGPITYPEEPVSLPKIDQLAEEALEKDQTPEEKSIPIQVVEKVVVEYTTESPVPDPMKKLSLPRLKLKTPTSSQLPPESTQYSTSPRPKRLPQTLPPQPPTIINLPIPLPDFASISSLDTIPPKSGKVTDKQVFKGLHVATAAACDEDVDKWIEEITGCGVRRVLADLSRFEGLGVNTLADVARRAAKQRRERVEAWEIVRGARFARMELKEEISRGVHKSGLSEVYVEREEHVDWAVGDQGIKKVDQLGCGMVNRRDCAGSEGVKRGGC